MKIFISYATSGAGHRIAATSIFETLKSLSPRHEVKFFDSLDYTTPLFRTLYPRIYLFLIRHLPRVWGFFYELTDSRVFAPFIARVRYLTNLLNSRPLIACLTGEKPDVVVSTHFFLPQVAGYLKRRGAGFRLVSVITDFRLHRFWWEPEVDTFIGACPETGEDLEKYGVKKEKVKILGIPLRPVFAEKKAKTELAGKFQKREGYFTVLVVSGGFGVGPIEGLVRALGKSKEKLQVLVVAGRNPHLEQRLKRLAEEAANPVGVFGFIDNIDELMEISDCLVTKSGGLTVAEALAKELPMIIIAPVPGQESRNAELLLKYKAALRRDTVDEAREAVEELSRSPEGLAEMKKGIALLSRPRAAFDIVRELL